MNPVSNVPDVRPAGSRQEKSKSRSAIEGGQAAVVSEPGVDRDAYEILMAGQMAREERPTWALDVIRRVSVESANLMARTPGRSVPGHYESEEMS